MLLREDGLFHLQEGLALLETLMLDSESRGADVARALGETYASRIYERIEAELARAGAAPEPLLRHLFAVIRSLDDLPFELPSGSREIKVEVVKQLIDLCYEGHPATAKKEAYRRLTEVSENH